MKYLNLKNFLTAVLLSCLLQTPVLAGDLSFDSFEAAEAAAKKRADEYQKRMEEHIKSVNDQWEKQQKDLGSDASSPDISKITTSSDGQKSSDTDASKSMEDAVNSSVNKLKDEMINKAGPNSTGFAGGAAGYQWSVKFKNGKYVLSDSYNEAEFNTGKKKEEPAATPAKEPAKEGGDDDQETAPVETVEKPAKDPGKTVSDGEPAEPAVQTAATTGKNDPAESKPATSEGGKTAEPGKPSAPAKVEEPAKPAPGVDPAPVKLPPPSVRMVIQHPTDFSEEVFSGNATSESTANYKLDKFKIPEDTRIKISVEVGDDVRPEDVSMIVTDDQGDSAPVSDAKLKNYRHMFRVPSDDQYSASVYVADNKTPGKQQKKILQVMIPVSKVDFESRTLDNQKGSKSGSNMAIGDTSSSASGDNSNKSGFGQPQQVDLSDLYSSPDSSSAGSSGSSAGSSGSSAGSSGSSDSSGSANSSDSSGSGDSALSESSSGSSDPQNSSDAGSSGNSPAGGQTGSGAEASGTGSSSSQDAGDTAGDEHSAAANSSGNTESSSDGSGINETGSSDAGVNSENGATHEGSGEQSPSDSGNGLTGGDSTSSADGSESSGDSSSDGDNRQSSTGSNDNGENGSSGIATTADGQNPDMNQAADSSAALAAGGSGDENKQAVDTAGKKQPGASQTGQSAQNEEDPFILALSLKAEAQKVYQSFDFIDGNSQTSADIKAGGEVAFSLNFGSQVEPDSVQIKVSDGAQEIRGNLKRMGESFVYVFPTPTQKAFIEVSGKTEKRSFSYRVGIPVR